MPMYDQLQNSRPMHYLCEKLVDDALKRQNVCDT